MNKEYEYAGFWIRLGATLIDSLLIMLFVMPMLMTVYGKGYLLADNFIFGWWDLGLNYVLPAIATILFWVYKSATPGKIATKLIILDAKTGSKATTKQLIGRYLAYYVSTLPLCLGFLWIVFDSRKQAWHDKLAGTVVIRKRGSEAVQFEQQ